MSRQLATFVMAAVMATGSQIQAHQVPVPVTPAAPTPVQGAPAPAVSVPVTPPMRPTEAHTGVPVQPTPPAPPRQGGRGAAPPAPGSPVAPVAATVPPRVERIPTQNVKVDLTITDMFGGSGSTKKTVTLLVADGWSGRIRSSNEVQVPYAGGPGGTPFTMRTITINVDCTPIVREGNRIQLNLTIEYVPELSTMNATTPTTRDVKPANINESLTVLVNDAKPTLLTQSADPATDRKVTVEVTATVVK